MCIEEQQLLFEQLYWATLLKRVKNVIEKLKQYTGNYSSNTKDTKEGKKGEREQQKKSGNWQETELWT